MDRTNHRIFYVDHNTKTTSWERPPPSPQLTPPSQIILPAAGATRPTPVAAAAAAATAGWGAPATGQSMTPMIAGQHHRSADSPD